MNLLDNDEVLQLAREDLACYAQALWPGFELAAHHELIVDMLELVERGEILRLLICLPPRHGKSLLASLLFPAWFLGRNPQKEIICASYGQDLADDFGRQVRNLVNDPKHRFIFPEFRLTADSNSMRRFRSDAGGGYFAVGRGGAVTGRGADLLILDDPLKDAAEAGSELIRRSLDDWYQAVGYTRLQPRGRIVLVATRWHEDDLTGRLLRQPGGEDWHILNLPPSRS